MEVLTQTDVGRYAMRLACKMVPQKSVVEHGYQECQQVTRILGEQLTHHLLLQARRGSYAVLANAVACLLNQQTNNSRQHWFVDGTGRLDYHDCHEQCERCGKRSHLEMAMIGGVVLCAECYERENHANNNN